MEITDVRVKLCNDGGEQLKAFCSVTLDGSFVVRDLKLIEGTSGLFVAMPSRKLADRCPKCKHKNHLRARFCNECGAKLRDNRDNRGGRTMGGRSKLYVDVAHPINTDCRKLVQEKIVAAYEEELARSKEPGYVAPDFEEEDASETADKPEAPDTSEKPEASDTADDSEPLDASDRSETAETSEYEKLIRELKNDAQERRQSHDRASEDSRRPVREEAPRPKPRPAPERSNTWSDAPAAPEPVPQRSAPPKEVPSGEDKDTQFGAGIL